MSTKIVTKNSSGLKRVILDYSKNLDLDYIFSQLEGVFFPGLSKAEITKLAVIQLFKTQESHNILTLTKFEEDSLALAINSKNQYTKLESDEDIKKFTASLAD